MEENKGIHTDEMLKIFTIKDLQIDFHNFLIATLDSGIYSDEI